MHLRHAFVRAFAILLIGSWTFAPVAVSAVGVMADAPVMSSDMAMDLTSAAADEMPCHKDKSDPGKNCPYMAICMALCCQGIPISAVSLAPPASKPSPLLPPRLVELYGMKFPPPSRPPKA
jgi:hypothetical protein